MPRAAVSTPRQHRRYARFAVSILLWLGFAAWLVYLFESQREYELNHFKRLETFPGIPIYHPGEVVAYNSSRKLLWIGWSAPETGFRWSATRDKTGFLFRTAATDNWRCASTLKIHVLATNRTQHVTLRIEDETIASTSIAQNGALVFDIPAGTIRPNAPVSVQLDLPDAGPPDGGPDHRVLGIAIGDIVIDNSC